jgi:hypothetical protein
LFLLFLLFLFLFAISDVWAFGITSYEILSRFLPYADIPAATIAVRIATEGITPIFPDSPWMAPMVELVHRCCFSIDAQARASMESIFSQLASIRLS